MSFESSKPSVGFVACIERGTLESQALLLFESIRRYSGRFSDCELYALSPRAGHAISRAAHKRLRELRVNYIDKVLNTECPEYGSANRVAAAAHAEKHSNHEILVILDSDTLFLREPTEVLLQPEVDLAVRPVDLKGICTSGAEDPCDQYWRELCGTCGVAYEDIPWGESFVDKARIKVSYNAGLVVVRRSVGIMQSWADFFFASVRRNVLPYSEPSRFRAGAGWVDLESSRFWGSNQAALSLAAWSSTRRIKNLPPEYNYPLHLHEYIDETLRNSVFANLIHVHYHWLLDEAPSANPLFFENGPTTAEQRHWLAAAGSQQRISRFAFW